MTKKRVIIITAAIVVFISMIATFVLNKREEEVPVVTDKSANTKIDIEARHVKITSTKGEVEVSNFYKDPVAEYQGSAVIEETRDYQISFVLKENRFYINLYNSGFESVIPTAEAALLEKLDIEVVDACKLDVVVRTDPVLIPGASETRSLSFCQ